MFQTGKPVTGKDFIGRKDELDKVQAYLEMGQSVALIAPRRFGKTSLVRELLGRSKQNGAYSGMVDVFSCPNILTLAQEITAEVLSNHQLKNVFQRLKSSATEMIKNVELRSVIQDFEFIVGYADTSIDEMDALAQSIKFVDAFTQKHGKNMVFALDEIGDVNKYKNHSDIIKLLRSEIQKQQQTAYLFSGSYESAMDAMFVSDKSPFYRMVRIVKLGYLPFAEVKQYMANKLKAHNVEVSGKLLEDTIDFLKGHPYYCQLALQQLYLFRQLRRKLPTLAELLEELLAVENSYLERIWEDYAGSIEYSTTLLNLVNTPTGIYGKVSDKRINLSRALSTLEGKGILYKEGKGYYFYDPLLEYYLAKMVR